MMLRTILSAIKGLCSGNIILFSNGCHKRRGSACNGLSRKTSLDIWFLIRPLHLVRSFVNERKFEIKF